jgi:hypothetical protein
LCSRQSELAWRGPHGRGHEPLCDSESLELRFRGSLRVYAPVICGSERHSRPCRSAYPTNLRLRRGVTTKWNALPTGISGLPTAGKRVIDAYLAATARSECVPPIGQAGRPPRSARLSGRVNPLAPRTEREPPSGRRAAGPVPLSQPTRATVSRASRQPLSLVLWLIPAGRGS